MRKPRDEQWSFVFEGFQAHLELPPSSQEFIFLYDASDAEASLFSSSLDSTRAMLTSAVLFYLHDPSLNKLHQGLVTTYPLLVSLPQMWVSEREVRAAIFSAVLYTNGLGATEALRESFYIESVAGISPTELGLDCRKIGSGLSNIQGAYSADFIRGQGFGGRPFSGVFLKKNKTMTNNHHVLNYLQFNQSSLISYTPIVLDSTSLMVFPHRFKHGSVRIGWLSREAASGLWEAAAHLPGLSNRRGHAIAGEQLALYLRRLERLPRPADGCQRWVETCLACSMAMRGTFQVDWRSGVLAFAREVWPVEYLY